MDKRNTLTCRALTTDRSRAIRTILLVALFSVIALLLIPDPALAAANSSNAIKDIIQAIVDDVIGPIFTGIGVILGFYSIGSLILAMKNDDPEAKTRAGMTLIVAAALIGFPTFIKNVPFMKYL